MSSRKTRRSNEQESQSGISKKAKIRLVIMLVSVFLMIFSVFQVYYLLRYTLGKSVAPKHLAVYKWVSLLVNSEDTSSVETEETIENNN